MNLARTLLTNHPLVNVLFAVVIFMGGLSYFAMPREQDPEISFNWVVVVIALPGASAEDVEDLVTSPIEDAIRQVRDIKFVSSSSRAGLSNILVRFRELSEREFDKRLNDLRREVQNKANDELPEDAEDPDIREITTSNGFPTALVVVTGQAFDERLRREARLVRDDLERLSGVSQVDTFGLDEPELIVELDPVRLAANGLGADEVADTLRASFADIFAGSANVGDEKWLVRLEATTADPDVLAQFPVASPRTPQARIPLGDIARIYRGREEPNQLVSLDGQPAISLSVSKVAYTNTLELVDRIREYIEARNAISGTAGFTVLLTDDQTVPTRQALSVMQRNALLGLTLVLGVSWAFLGLRIAALVTAGLVFSIAGTLWALHTTGNTLNVSVLLGIVIVLGMLVDDAVVVVEAIYYRLQRGAAAIDASVGALREVAQPVTSAVMTTAAAFLPLMLMPGIVGDFMFIMPFVVVVGLAVSLVEAFWILPAHVVDFTPARAHQRRDRDLRTRITHRIRLRYTRMLTYVMRRPVPFLLAGFLAMLLALAAVFSGFIKSDWFTNDPLRIFYVNVDMPPDAPLEETLAQSERVEQRLRPLLEPDEARAVTVLAGIKFTETEMLVGDQYGQIQVSLNPRRRDSRTVPELVEALRDQVQSTPGDADITFLQISGGPPVLPPVNVKVRSDDFDELERAAQAVKEIVGGIDGTSDVAGRPRTRAQRTRRRTR